MDGGNYFREIKKHCLWKRPLSEIKHSNKWGKREKCFVRRYFGSQPFLMSCYFTIVFVHLSEITAGCYFSVYKLIGWNSAGIVSRKSSSRNTYIVEDDLLIAFCKLFWSRLCVSSDQWKNTVQKRFYWHFEKYFYLKTIVIVMPTNLDANVFLFFVYSFVEFQNKNQMFSRLMVW